MIAPQPAGEPLRVLWLTSRPGTPSSVRPDLELARELARAAIDVHIIAPADSYYAQAAGQAGCTVIGYPPRGLLGPRIVHAWPNMIRRRSIIEDLSPARSEPSMDARPQ